MAQLTRKTCQLYQKATVGIVASDVVVEAEKNKINHLMIMQKNARDVVWRLFQLLLYTAILLQYCANGESSIPNGKIL